MNPNPASLSAPAKLSHVALRTNNIRKMTEWYALMLGGEAILDTPNASFFRCGSELLAIAILQIPNTSKKSAQTNGLEHFAFTFDTLEELVLMYKERKAINVLPFRAVHHGPTISMYYKDPDGNKVEMQVEVIKEVEAFLDYSSSDAMRKNPVGVEMDPEEIVKTVESGNSPSLLERPDIGERGFDHIK